VDLRTIPCRHDTDYLGTQAGKRLGQRFGPVGATIGALLGTWGNERFDWQAVTALQQGGPSLAMAELSFYAYGTPCFHTNLVTNPEVYALVAAKARAYDVAARAAAEPRVDVTRYQTADFASPTGRIRCQLTESWAFCHFPPDMDTSAVPQDPEAFCHGDISIAGVRVTTRAGFACSGGLIAMPGLSSDSTAWFGATRFQPGPVGYYGRGDEPSAGLPTARPSSMDRARAPAARPASPARIPRPAPRSLCRCPGRPSPDRPTGRTDLPGAASDTGSTQAATVARLGSMTGLLSALLHCGSCGAAVAGDPRPEADLDGSSGE
jgi:hypothetical protein